MVGFRALVVYAQQEPGAQLARALGSLGVSADAVSSPAEAIALLEGERYGALLLDDELPGGGSLELFEALDTLEQNRPPVLMVCVPRAVLAQMRQGSSDGVEYVATPETEAEVERLALRVRTRLVNAGLAADFGATPPRSGGEPGSGPLVPRAARDRRPYYAIIAVLAILLVLLVLLNYLDPPRAGALLPTPPL